MSYHASQITFIAHFTAEPHTSQAALVRSCVAVLGVGTTGSFVLSSLAASGVGHLVGIDLPGSSGDHRSRIHEHVHRDCIARNPRANYRSEAVDSADSDTIARAVEGARLLIVALDSPNPALLDAVDDACMRAMLTWTAIGIRAWEGYVGPTVVPRQTACYTCYDLRMKANLANYEPYKLYEDRLKGEPHDRVFGALPQFSPIIGGLAATEALKILTDYCTGHFGLYVDLRFLDADGAATRNPQASSLPQVWRAVPTVAHGQALDLLELEGRRRCFSTLGSERETGRLPRPWSRPERAVDERVGIIKYVTDRAIEPDDPRVFQAATEVTDVAPLRLVYPRTDRKQRSRADERDGDGQHHRQSLERYCSAIYDGGDLVVDSYSNLARQGKEAVRPHAFALHSATQYARPGFIHHPFTEDTVVSWTQGYSLTREEPILVPACLVYVPYRFHHPGDLIAFGVSSGLCCARSTPAAILGGLYEVIERDAIMIMWMNQMARARVDLTSGSWLPEVVRERFTPSMLGVHVNDITSDLPVPVMFALLIDRTNDGLAVVAGASANLDPQAAALKAMVEAAQGRRWLKMMNRRGLMPPTAQISQT